MADDPSKNSETQDPSPEAVEHEIRQMFDSGTLRPEDFSEEPGDVAEDVRSQVTAYNRVVKPAADLSSEIMQASAAGLAESFDSIDDPEGPTRDRDELVAEFERLTSEDSEVVRTADELLNTLVPLYRKSEMHTDESFSFQDVYNGMRDVCPETARVYAGVFEVLGRTGDLDEYTEDA